MKNKIFSACFSAVLFITAALISGCQSNHKADGNSSSSATSPQPPAVAATAPSTNPVTKAPPIAKGPVRIKAGGPAFKDSDGNAWLGDQGFAGGETVERPDVAIANTTHPEIYRSEHYLMDSFSWPLANGKYLVKLHFCETFENIEGPAQRVFSFNVQGREFKDFDVWVKAGGPFKAYIETVPVEITNGKLLITFTNNIENQQINGIEIIPQL